MRQHPGHSGRTFKSGLDHPSVELAVGALLRATKLTLATAESCTGGLIGQRITDVSGSSDYYAGGVIAYSNAVKMTLLGVSESCLTDHGAVSATVAEAMASGVLHALGVDLALSTTGIAGPTGGTAEKPVGLVFIGLAARGKPPVAHEYHFDGNRETVRMAASQAALKMLQHYLASDY